MNVLFDGLGVDTIPRISARHTKRAELYTGIGTRAPAGRLGFLDHLAGAQWGMNREPADIAQGEHGYRAGHYHGEIAL